MPDFPPYADIVLFGMIAAFLVLRLRSVLGRRTGNERRREAVLRQADPAQDKVVDLPQRRLAAPIAMPVATAPAPGSVAAGLAQVQAADHGFEPGAFLDGARGAFQIVVGAFAAGDKDRLRPLLSDDTFRSFAAAIDARHAAGETMETRIVELKSLDIVAAGVEGADARVKVKLVSDQINVVRSADGAVVDGDPEVAAEKSDFWTFSRDTRSGDPNWALVATGA